MASVSLSTTSSSYGLTLPTKSSVSLTTSTFHGIRVPNPNPSSLTRLRAQQPQSSSSGVVMMAKREEELKEIRTRTTQEINDEILQLKGELFMLRLQKTAREDFKPSDFGLLRKKIARMLTVKREREIEEGIGKRLSRKLDREWKKSVVIKPPAALKNLQQEKVTAEAEKTS